MKKRTIRIIALILASIMILSLFAGITAHASDVGNHELLSTEELSNYGNEWVYDEPDVISQTTEEYIKNLNEAVFPNYKNKPQLAFIVIEELPTSDWSKMSINEYKLMMFNELGVGTKEENCGMLFVISINDRSYGLEIGNGYVKGSALRKAMETNFITDEMKTLLQSNNYDFVILQIAKHLELIMKNEEDGVYARQEAEAESRANAIAESWKVTETKATKIWLTFLFVLIGGIVGFVAIWYIYQYISKGKRNRQLLYTLDQNYAYLNIIGITPEMAKQYIDMYYTDVSIEEILDNLIEILHQIYIKKEAEQLKKDCPIENHYEQYIKYLKQINDVTAFKNKQLTDIYDITYHVDQEEKRKAELLNENKKHIVAFWNSHIHMVENPAIHQGLKTELFKCLRDDRVITENELKEVFDKQKDKLSFKWEFDQFLSENCDKIEDVRDLDQDELYHEIRKTDNYRDYRYNRFYDRSWMMPLLMMHMTHRRRERIKKERREEAQRQERERRRREEAKRQAESMRTNNSSFGGGFRGGKSSGGGFSGGW